MSLCIWFFSLLLVSPLVAEDQDLATLIAERCKKAHASPIKNTGDYKAAIEEIKALIAKKPTAEFYLNLAVLQLQDQQEEEAFKTYLLCLENTAAKQNTMSSAEKAKFDELLALYFANSEELQSKVAATLKSNPNYLQCQFFLASQAANERRYEPFFYLFYQSYCQYPDCHMAHKTKGVIASLILQRARSLEEKDLWRNRALTSLNRAMNICPEDIGLHRMYMFTASDKERKEAVQKVFALVLDKNIQIPRTEIPLYIQYALAVDELNRAELLLDKAKTWYEYSRIIQQMQELITQAKAEKSHERK